MVSRQGGKGNVVMIAEAEFAGWQETVHLLGGLPNAERLLRVAQQFEAGQGVEHGLAPTRARESVSLRKAPLPMDGSSGGRWELLSAECPDRLRHSRPFRVGLAQDFVVHGTPVLPKS